MSRSGWSMWMRWAQRWGLLICLTMSQLPPVVVAQPTAERLPNIVVIFIDDLGYGDLRPFGAPDYETPHLDALARSGRVFTDFCVPSAVCSASRAALLTGCYPTRVGIHGALGPGSSIGLSDKETTLAELCRSRGYATACVGKWHLGDHVQFLPLQHGFDFYYGLPYSNDMWPLHPDLVRLPEDVRARRKGYPDLPLLRGNDIVHSPVTADDQTLLTQQYTEQAVQFLRDHANQPFLIYLAHTMVHVPLHVSAGFAGRSGTGLFGDCVQEIDWSVGQMLGALRDLSLLDKTLVVFTSDNGPWLSYGDHAGNAGPLREGKGTSFEGGVRVPMIASWPGRIPAATVCHELATTMDVLPTVAALIGAPLPDHPLDGHDIRPLLFGANEAVSPYESLAIYYGDGQLQAVRDRRFKLVLPHSYRTLSGRPGGTGGLPAAYTQAESSLALFDLANDIAESVDVAAQFPEERERLLQQAERFRDELGDRLQNRVGSRVRAPGKIDR